MFIKFVSIVLALVIGGTVILGAGIQPVYAQTQPQPTPSVAPVPGSGQNDQQPSPDRLSQAIRRVRRALVQATASVTGKQPKEVIQALRGGQSLADFAASLGKSAEDIFKVFDEKLTEFFNRITGKKDLTESQVQQRKAYFQEAARQMVDQPGLSPAYPDIQLLRRVLLRSAVKVGELDRAELKDGLKACQSLDDLLAAKGHTGQEAVDAAVVMINHQLDRAVTAGKMTQEQRDQWSASLTSELSQLASTPGMRPGKACAP